MKRKLQRDIVALADFRRWLKAQRPTRRFARCKDGGACPLAAYSGHLVGTITYKAWGAPPFRTLLPPWAVMFVSYWDGRKAPRDHDRRGSKKEALDVLKIAERAMATS